VEVDQHHWVLPSPQLHTQDSVGMSSESSASEARPKIHKKQSRKILKVVAGVDISFVKDTDEACACVTFLSFPDLRPLHTAYSLVTMNLPYISGFLAFREVEPIAEVYRQVAKGERVCVSSEWRI
jgi:deoxyinosine 3'endonuclease (endonuclease V)